MNHIGYKFFRITRMLRSFFYKYYNRFWFSAMGIEYGKNMQIRNKIYVSGMGEIKIGDDFLCSSGDGINPIGRNIRGEIASAGRIVIGDRVGVSSSCIYAHDLVVMGNDVHIGSDTLIIDHDGHPHNYIMRRRGEARNKVNPDDYAKSLLKAPIVIEDDVWIGARCLILKGVRVGARSIIAAGSVVTKSIPADVIAGGNPCKVIRGVSKDE